MPMRLFKLFQHFLRNEEEGWSDPDGGMAA
jgi:hypothetical protein